MAEPLTNTDVFDTFQADQQKESGDVFDQFMSPDDMMLQPVSDTDLFLQKQKQRGIALGQGAVGGLAEASPMVVGGVLGARVGFGISPPHPLAKGAFGTAGMLIGGAAGAWPGREIRKRLSGVMIDEVPLTYERLSQVPYELRPYFVAGEAFGGSLPFAAAPFYGVARGTVFAQGQRIFNNNTANFVANLPALVMNSIINKAGYAPKAFLATEALLAASSGVGGGLAEEYFPGSLLARVTGETAGGLVNVPKWTGLMAVKITKGIFQRLKAGVSKLAVETQGPEAILQTTAGKRAAELVASAFADSGGDPLRVAQTLNERAAEFPELAKILNSAQLTQDPTLLGLQRILMGHNKRFSDEAGKAAEDGLEALRLAIHALENTGDPIQLQAAMAAKKELFEGAIETLVKNDLDRVVQAVADIDVNDVTQITAWSKEAGDILEASIDRVRGIAKDKLSAITPNTFAPTMNGKSKYVQLKKLMRVGDKENVIGRRFIPAIEDFYSALSSPAKEGSKKTPPRGTQLIELYNDVMFAFKNKMKIARASAPNSPEWLDAERHGEMAEAILDDIRAMAKDDNKVQEAVDFIDAIYEKYTNSYTSKMLGSQFGENTRIPPEVILQNAFGVGRPAGDIGELTAHRFNELQEAASLAKEEYGARMIALQMNTIQWAVTKLIDPDTGRIAKDELDRFISKNIALLKRPEFSVIKEKLKNVKSAEEFLLQGETIEGFVKSDMDTIVFRSLVKDDPVHAVGSIWRKQGTRGPELEILADMAVEAGESAQDGLTSSLFRMLYRNASVVGETLNWSKFLHNLTDPMNTGFRSVLEMMTNKNLISRSQGHRVRLIAQMGRDLENLSEGIRPSEKTVNKITDAVAGLFLALSGARVGGLLQRTLPGASSGGSLVFAQRFSGFFQTLFGQFPEATAEQALVAILQNDRVTEIMLRNLPDAKTATNALWQLHSELYQAGLISGIARNPVVSDYYGTKEDMERKKQDIFSEYNQFVPELDPNPPLRQ